MDALDKGMIHVLDGGEDNVWDLLSGTQLKTYKLFVFGNFRSVILDQSLLTVHNWSHDKKENYYAGTYQTLKSSGISAIFG
jgi:hypothetical protein